MIANNPVDWDIYNYYGMAIDVATIAFDMRTSIEKADEYLRHWMSRHPNDYFILSDNPLSIKITATPHDINVYNHNMHEKYRKYRGWER